jgi:hypothetical protein
MPVSNKSRVKRTLDPGKFTDRPKLQQIARAQVETQIKAQIASNSRTAGGNSTDRLKGRPAAPKSISIGGRFAAPTGGVRPLARQRPFSL